MRLKLAYKLFGAFFLILVMVAGTMALGRYIFSRNFKNYIQQVERQRLESLVPALQGAYRAGGNWDGLKADVQHWRRLMHMALDTHMPGPPPNLEHGPPPKFEHGPPPGPKPPAGAGPGKPPPEGMPPGGPPGVFLMDARHRPVVGMPAPDDQRDLVAIEVDGRIVGWLGLHRHEPLTSGPSAAFLKHQAKQFYLLGGMVIGITALVAFLFSRHLLRPIQRLARGTRELADRNFSVRIAPGSGDELGQLAENFNTMARTLESYESMRRQWLTDISHELRTPLSVLRGEIEALQDGVREPTAANLDSLHTEVLGINKLVKDLHLLSIADSDRLLLNKQRISPCKVLAPIIETYQTRFDRRRITLETRLTAAETAHINGDADRLAQVFTNILENAHKYMSSPGALHISGKADDQSLTLQFEDTGPGVPEEALPRLFDRLFRVDASRNRRSGGSGLGLSICRHIIENHDGRIWAQRSPQGGLGITINFPLTRKKTA